MIFKQALGFTEVELNPSSISPLIAESSQVHKASLLVGFHKLDEEASLIELAGSRIIQTSRILFLTFELV